jgi:hypothetical protein
MNTWPDTDGKIIARYLGQLRLRYPISPIYYRQALRSFQEVVVRQQYQSSRVTREAMEIWLSECALIWSSSTLLHRARIVNRFLDFLVQKGLITRNPIADLRAEYHAKSDTAIVRALLAPDADQALESLRQFPPFGSVLGETMRNHITLMQARGFRYQTQARWFWRFDRFLQAHPEFGGGAAIGDAAALGGGVAHRQPCRRVRETRSCLSQGRTSVGSQLGNGSHR